MCFGSSKVQQAETPAAAPAAPDPAAKEQEIGSARKAEDQAAYGTSGKPQTRVNRALSGAATSGGAGLYM
jgi:hypothetical protein